jgi:undecaprenyl pyrophosphate synthase
MKTLEFRDGEKDVPDHVAVLMRGLRTWELTYVQAREQAHNNQLRQALEVAQRDLIRQHNRNHGA